MADTEQIAPSITGTHEWAAVAQHHAAVAPRHLRELFTDDPGRVEALTASGAQAARPVEPHSGGRQSGRTRTSRRCGTAETISTL